MQTQILKLYTSDGKSLTDLASRDETVTLPNAIVVDEDGTAYARHADAGDFGFDNLGELCDAYGLDLAAVQQAIKGQTP